VDNTTLTKQVQIGCISVKNTVKRVKAESSDTFECIKTNETYTRLTVFNDTRKLEHIVNNFICRKT